MDKHAAAVKILHDLLTKLDVMNGCNEHDMQGPEAWPEFIAAQELVDKFTLI